MLGRGHWQFVIIFTNLIIALLCPKDEKMPSQISSQRPNCRVRRLINLEITRKKKMNSNGKVFYKQWNVVQNLLQNRFSLRNSSYQSSCRRNTSESTTWADSFQCYDISEVIFWWQIHKWNFGVNQSSLFHKEFTPVAVYFLKHLLADRLLPLATKLCAGKPTRSWSRTHFISSSCLLPCKNVFHSFSLRSSI